MLMLREPRKIRESIMPHAALKLVATEPVDHDVLRFERRFIHRRFLAGRVTSLQKSNDNSFTRNRIDSIQLCDISDTGVGALSQEPIQPNTTIVIFFSPQEADHGFEYCGRVVYCTPCDEGYRIGIRFQNRSAA